MWSRQDTTRRRADKAIASMLGPRRLRRPQPCQIDVKKHSIITTPCMRHRHGPTSHGNCYRAPLTTACSAACTSHVLANSTCGAVKGRLARVMDATRFLPNQRPHQHRYVLQPLSIQVAGIQKTPSIALFRRGTCRRRWSVPSNHI
jgi:hypothetical protein